MFCDDCVGLRKIKRNKFSQEDSDKLLVRLKKADPRMFNYFAHNQVFYEDCLLELSNKGKNTDYNLVEMILNALDALEKIQFKVRNIGENLRHHKFEDFDRRETKGKKGEIGEFIYKFPDSVLEENFEISDECEVSVEKCIDTLFTTFR